MYSGPQNTQGAQGNSADSVLPGPTDIAAEQRHPILLSQHRHFNPPTLVSIIPILYVSSSTNTAPETMSSPSLPPRVEARTPAQARRKWLLIGGIVLAVIVVVVIVAVVVTLMV
ncbi:hypothetical protein HBH63_196950 [Parastagonospora nodorum]|nr:hypothetical protein HBH63_196950 [Parastagonospora nodorum]